eukprot:TRINITY_DN2637_c0_g1_i1.p1 TRINITY_DN2637_c0_g1~~TRINITY_DN2637_c0_g1_i1.p1  ORF type:complete len:476 (-),score=110.54 TRINITY_DN2637_c0_g1_i1:779-2143(-)
MANPTSNHNLQVELMELLHRLHELGAEYPNYVVFLSEVVQPSLPPEHRIPVLCKMFEEVPGFLTGLSPASFSQLVTNPPPEAVSFRLLLQLYELSNFFRYLSSNHLFHLTNNVIPPGPVDYQVMFMVRAQEYFHTLSRERLQILQQSIAGIPPHEETPRLISLEPKLPQDVVRLFSELLKLSFEELVSFAEWFSQLARNKLPVLLVILQQESVVLWELKRRLTLSTFDVPQVSIPHFSPHSSTSSMPTHDPNMYGLSQPLRTSNGPSSQQSYVTPTSPPPPIFDTLDSLPDLSSHFPPQTHPAQAQTYSSHHHIPPHMSSASPHSPHVSSPASSSSSAYIMSPSSSALTTGVHPDALPLLPLSNVEPASSFSTIQLKMARQPPTQTVYQRILKPFPTVMVTGFSPGENSNLFVEVTMLRGDSEVELATSLSRLFVLLSIHHVPILIRPHDRRPP